jgi:hypothetical protein
VPNEAFYPIDRGVGGAFNDRRVQPSKIIMQPEKLVTLFQPWPPPPTVTEAGLVFGMEVAVLVTPWLELADAALVHSEGAKPRHRRLRPHLRRARVALPRHRRSA